MKELKKILFSPVTMVILLVILAFSLATATFIENDFGSEVAKSKVYNSRWLEFIWLILTINLIGRVIQLKLYKPQKFTIFLFHIALVVMIIGAAVTRYFGYEGSMHIREGQSSSTLITYDKVVSLNVDNSLVYQFKANIEQKRDFEGELKDKLFSYTIKLDKFYENAYPQAVAVEGGEPIVNFVVAGSGFRGSDYLTSGEIKNYGGTLIGFQSSMDADVQLYAQNDSVFMLSNIPVFITSMGGDEGNMKVGEPIALQTRTLYKINKLSFVLQEYIPEGQIIPMPTTMQNHAHGTTAMLFSVSDGNTSSQITLWGNQSDTYSWGTLNKHRIGLKYGNATIELPFSIYLDDFVIERYPGSMSPSSFSSYVTLHEEGKDPVPFHIYMNNILKHHGFRFYQSSYDQDEKGTILSVNRDKWGTMITYFGYFLLTLGMLLSMVNKNSFFIKTVVRNVKVLIVGTTILAGTLFATDASAQHGMNPHASAMPATIEPSTALDGLPDDFIAIDKKHSEDFGKILIQNNKGRTEPIYTYASELLRKISRKESMFGLSPVQVFMEMNMNPELWIDMPIIRVTNQELQEQLGLEGKYAAYTDFISNRTGYALQSLVQSSFAKSPSERTKYDKAVIKTDEKINICYGIFSGKYMKVLPLPDDSSHTHWYPSKEASLMVENPEDSLFLASIVEVYFEEVELAKNSGDYSTANEFLNGLKKYQKSNAGYELPSDAKTSIEIIYYKYNVFKKLFPFYATAGVIFLFILIGIIVAGRSIPQWLRSTFFAVILIGFIGHTLGVAARWYISGHAPMSNGYESMIFISWVTLLAGFLFSKRSPFAIPATAALGGLTLMVANLSFMDPEITNLVPVLQSYWLTIHVSVITASYGFLGLGALLGIINLLLIILRSKRNHKHIIETLESLTIINHKTLIAGLYLLTIGTFLGAVWANESWGRYWGWDPKETWALISVIVYTIVTHARLIPGMKGVFIFNTLALFGFASILMTYFGVNYYLSGLHSYAGGDPVPVPSFVYYTVAAVVILTLAASVKYRNLLDAEAKNKK